MMRTTTKRTLRSVALTTLMAVCTLTLVLAQRPQPSHSSSQPSYHSAPQSSVQQHQPSSPSQPRMQTAPVQRAAPSAPPSGVTSHPAAGYPPGNGYPSGNGSPYSNGYPSGNTARPGYAPNNMQPTRPGYPAPNTVQPSRPAYVYPGAAPPGHLGSWLNDHSNVPPQERERLLRSDPSFNRLPLGEQQRLVQQLHQVDSLNDQQRQRRLARAEALEHLSPHDRMSLNHSNQSFAALPNERQALVKRAFQDLRAVPLDQRPTVLNSARYQGAFSPEERGILTDFLRVEPYEPAH